MLKLYNTKDRKVTEFAPNIMDTVSMYSCGPTVYSYAHIGNMRAYLFMDLLRRVLRYNNYNINGVINITDVGHLTSDEDEGEDKMAVASKREKKTVWEIADYYTDFFMTQAKKLNIDMPEKVVRATDTISEMISMIEVLINKGYAYETSKGVYYDVVAFKEYGSLSGMSLDQKLAGARIEVDSEKKNPADFALWVKAPKEHIMQWQSPWGMGYPGWHIECSAIGIKELGDKIDIHTGGIDHVPVHHENEIAQNYGFCEHEVVNRWMHVEFLQVDGGKMSKSLGNIYTIDQLEEKGYRALDFKYFCLNAHYSKKINFTFEVLNGSNTALTRLYDLAIQNKNSDAKTNNDIIEKYRNEFKSAINNDLNAPLALSVVWNMLRSEEKSKDIYELLVEFDSVLGLDIENAENDKEIKKLNEKLNESDIPEIVLGYAKERMNAKLEKNWAKSDELRNLIESHGYKIIDNKDGYEINKI